jgi:hypothetical protein
LQTVFVSPSRKSIMNAEYSMPAAAAALQKKSLNSHPVNVELNKVIQDIKVAITKPTETIPVYRVNSKPFKDHAFLLTLVLTNKKGNERTLEGTDIPCIEFTVDPDTVIHRSAFNNSIPNNQPATVFNKILDIFYKEVAEFGKVSQTHHHNTVILKCYSLCISIAMTSPKTFKIITYSQ